MAQNMNVLMSVAAGVIPLQDVSCLLNLEMCLFKESQTYVPHNF